MKEIKEILGLLASAKSQLEVISVNISAIKDEEVVLMSDIATQVTELQNLFERTRMAICSKQSTYFHLLASCIAEIEGVPMSRYPGKKFTCDGHEIIVHDLGSTGVHVCGGSYDPDEIETPLFVSLCESMINVVIAFPDKQRIDQGKLEEK